MSHPQWQKDLKLCRVHRDQQAKKRFLILISVENKPSIPDSQMLIDAMTENKIASSTCTMLCNQIRRFLLKKTIEFLKGVISYLL
jgi:hypothetical protein